MGGPNVKNLPLALVGMVLAVGGAIALASFANGVNEPRDVIAAVVCLGGSAVCAWFGAPR